MDRRLKRILISDELLMDILINAVADKKEIPSDATAVGVYYDQSRKCFDLAIHSKEYPELPEGGMIEVINPIFTRERIDGP